MNELHYSICKDKNFIYEVLNNVDTITEYIIVLEDGKIRISSRYLIINLMLWPILCNMGLTIHKKHIYSYSVLSEDNLADLLTKYYEEILTLEDALTYIEKLKEELWQFHNLFYNFATIYFSEYAASIDILDLANITLNDDIKKLTNINFDVTTGTEVVELQLKSKTKELIKLIIENSNISKNIKDFIEPGLLNTNQLSPMFIACGVKTDINDVVVRCPVKSNIVNGLQDVKDYTLEHLSAKKSIYYNSVAIKDSQYFGRKQQLASLAIEKIYYDNCGSSLTIPFLITNENSRNIIGKNIIYDNQLININKYNHKFFIDKEINLKSPLTCRYQDGVCVSCGSTLMYNFPSKLHLGMHCSSNFTSIVTQLILSNKHVGSTKSLVYQLTDESVELFSNRVSGVYWKKDAFESMGDWRIGISLKDIRGSLDDIHLVQDNNLKEERFTQLTGMILQSSNRGEQIVPLISKRHVPFLSIETLKYINNIFDQLDIEDSIIWIPMNNFPRDKPFIKAPIINDSMLAFVKSVTGFVQEDISTYTSATECLKAISDLIYSKVSVNLLCLEVLLKAYMITSEIDYRVPLVNDINNIKFQNNAKLITGRSISSVLSFQNLSKYISSFDTYLYPKSSGIMDKYFGFSQ